MPGGLLKATPMVTSGSCPWNPRVTHLSQRAENSTEDLIQDPETHSLQHTWKKPGATAVVSEGSRTLSLLLRHG